MADTKPNHADDRSEHPLTTAQQFKDFMSAIEDVERKVAELRKLVENPTKTSDFLRTMRTLGVYGQRLYTKSVKMGGSRRTGDVDSLIWAFLKAERERERNGGSHSQNA